MTNPVIKVENLSKYYRLGVIGGGTLREDISRWWAQKRGNTDPYSKIGEEASQQPRGGQIWALEDINMEVNEGEILGIIGRNGAGKSTLLKILSRITAPTSGRAVIRGRVGSLLEVGTGFHPELTGRENIYLNGSILGMRRSEVTRKLDEIVEFASVDKFVDTPVKRYSSGMLVRLAFAVAAHLEPEILIVDEVLAVGDAAFQKKCLGKMKDVSSHGRTVLFVSHNMQSISTLTNACALVDSGKLSFKGSTEDAIHKYLKTYSGHGGQYIDESPDDIPKITRVALVTSEPNYKHVNGKNFKVEIDINTDRVLKNACVSFQIIDDMLRPIVHCWVFSSDIPLCRKTGIYKLKCSIPKLRLYMGEYALIVHFSENEGGEKFQTLEGVCRFEVVMHGIEREYKWSRGACAYIEDFSWDVQEQTYDV